MTNYMKHPVKIDITADGTVTIRETIHVARIGLPFYSTDTVEEAKLLRATICIFTRDKPGRYVVAGFNKKESGNPFEAVDRIDGVAKRFHEAAAQIRANKS